MMKQILANTQAHRDASMILFDVIIALAESKVATTPQEQNKLYAKKVAKKGKGHGLGSPYLWTTIGVFMGLMLTIADSLSYSRPHTKMRDRCSTRQTIPEPRLGTAKAMAMDIIRYHHA